MTRHEWGDWHVYAAIVFGSLCAVHLVLNRAWLVKIGASRHGWRLWAGLGLGVCVVLVLACWPSG